MLERFHEPSDLPPEFRTKSDPSDSRGATWQTQISASVDFPSQHVFFSIINRTSILKEDQRNYQKRWFLPQNQREWKLGWGSTVSLPHRTMAKIRRFRSLVNPVSSSFWVKRSNLQKNINQLLDSTSASFPHPAPSQLTSIFRFLHAKAITSYRNRFKTSHNTHIENSSFFPIFFFTGDNRSIWRTRKIPAEFAYLFDNNIPNKAWLLTRSDLNQRRDPCDPQACAEGELA